MVQNYNTIPERHVLFSRNNNNRAKQKQNLMHGFMRIKSGKNKFYIVLISEKTKNTQKKRIFYCQKLLIKMLD
jgi:hypothetical protein